MNNRPSLAMRLGAVGLGLLALILWGLGLALLIVGNLWGIFFCFAGGFTSGAARDLWKGSMQ